MRTRTCSPRSPRSAGRSSSIAFRRRAFSRLPSSVGTTSRLPATSRSARPRSCARRLGESPRSESWPRPTAPTSRRNRGAAGRTSPPTSSTRSRRSRPRGARTPRSWRLESTPTPPRPSPCPSTRPRRERSSEERARPALPRRREHSRRHRQACGARGRRCRARDRPGSRRPDGVPRRSRIELPCDRARPDTGAGAPGGARRSRERSAAARRRARPRPCRARADSEQARRQPAVQRRDTARRGEPRPSTGPGSLVRDGPARGRGPFFRRAGDESVRRCFRPRSARRRADWIPSRFAQRLPAASERRVGARLDRARADDSGGSAGAGGVRGTRRRAPVKRAPATAKLNLALVVGRPRPDGRHELTTVLQRLDLSDRVAIRPAPRLRVLGFADDTLVGRALERLGEASGVPPRWEARLTKRIPVAAGLGGGSSDAATALRLANATLEEPLEPDRLRGLAAELGSDAPFFLAQGPQLGEGDGTVLTPLDLPQDYWVLLVRPTGVDKASTADVYGAFDGRDGGKGYRNRRAALRRALKEIRRPRDLARLPPNDLASSPLADDLVA